MSQPAPQNFMQRAGATPGKLALIGVLAIILTYVIVSQLPSTPPPRLELVTPEPAASAVAPVAPLAAVPAEQAVSGEARAKPWPAADLDAVVRFDPFAAPAWAVASAANLSLAGSPAAAAANQRAEALAKLRTLGAAVIMEVDGEPLALVGEQQIRVGDRLEGFQVKQITESGIILTTEELVP